MNPEQFQVMMAEAGKRKITLEDVYHLLNKDKVNQNVANNTKDDMLKQMKNVRNIPTSASGTNSAQVQSSPDDNVFDNIIGSDGDIDNLFGQTIFKTDLQRTFTALLEGSEEQSIEG